MLLNDSSLGGFTCEIPLFLLLRKQIVLRGVSVGPRRAFEDMNREFARLRLRPVIDAVYPFADTLSAYEHLDRGAIDGAAALDRHVHPTADRHVGAQENCRFCRLRIANCQFSRQTAS